MSPEFQQYAIYAGLVLAGVLARHFGLPGLPTPAPFPSSSPAPASSPTPAPPNSPATLNGTQLPALPESVLKALDQRFSALEARINAIVPGANDALSAQLASLAHRLLDKNSTPSTPA